MIILFALILLPALIRENWNLLFKLLILCLAGNGLFITVFGSQVLFAHIIALICLPFALSGIRLNYLKGLWLEYILLLILALYYGLFNPWVDNSVSRSWSQVAGGRSLVACIRIFLELSTIQVTYFLYRKSGLSFIQLADFISKMVIGLVCFAFLDLALNHRLLGVLAPSILDNHEVGGRLIGLSHEPRSFGRLLVFPIVYLSLLIVHGVRSHMYGWAMFIGFIGLVGSGSFSTYILIAIFIVILVGRIRFNKRVIRNLGLSLVITTLVISISAYIVPSRTLFQLKRKLEMVAFGNVVFLMPGEPLVFSSFEVFDRAALNFFYRNPSNIYFGTGPNLISIPSSKYLDRSAKETFNGTIVSVPGVGLIYMVSRSGLLGLILYSLSVSRVRKHLLFRNKKLNSDLLLVVAIQYLFVVTPWIYFTLGLSIKELMNKE